MSEEKGELSKSSQSRRRFLKMAGGVAAAAATTHLFGTERATAQAEFNPDKIRRNIEGFNNQLKELASIINTRGRVDNIGPYAEASMQRRWNLTQLMQRRQYAHMARGLFLDDDTIRILRTAAQDLLIETPKSEPEQRQGRINFAHDEYFSSDGQITVLSYPVIHGEGPLDIHEIYSDRYQAGEIDLSQFPRGSLVRAEGRMLGTSMFIDRLTLINP